MTIALDLKDLTAARERIRGEIVHTPLNASESLSKRIGAAVSLKHENLQLTGSFKFRGASHKLARLVADGERPAGVVARSSRGRRRAGRWSRRRRAGRAPSGI